MRPLDLYPDSFGGHRASVFPHAGPASYTQMAADSPVGVPVTGGDDVEAVEAGMKYFDYLVGGISDDGLYEVVAVPKARSDYQSGAAQTEYVLVWYTISTRTQVAAETDLSGSIVRLFAVGPK